MTPASAMSGRDVLVRRPLPSAEVRLLCLGHAGAGPSAFHSWPGLLDPDAEVLVAALPGRESRFAEPADVVLADLAGAVLALGDGRPLAVLGHSVGAWRAFELVRLLCAAADPRLPVARLIVSGAAPPPTAPALATTAPGIDDAGAIRALRSLGGTPSAVLEDPDLLEIVLPAVRADLTWGARYACPEGTVVDLPLSILAGVDDPRASPAAMAGWMDRVGGPVTAHPLPGGHFFLFEQAEGVAGLIRTDLHR